MESEARWRDLVRGLRSRQLSEIPTTVNLLARFFRDYAVRRLEDETLVGQSEFRIVLKELKTAGSCCFINLRTKKERERKEGTRVIVQLGAESPLNPVVFSRE